MEPKQPHVDLAESSQASRFAPVPILGPGHTLHSVTEKISMIVTDVLGRIIEKRDNLTNNQVYRIGDNYKTGLYFIELRQGKEKVSTKILKL